MGELLPDLSILRRSWLEYADPATTHRVRVKDSVFGGSDPVVIAGPCAVESLEQTLNIAREVRRAGAGLMRGGAYKPRTNPHSLQGLGIEALEIFAAVRRRTGLGIVTEVMDTPLAEPAASYADMLLIASSSIQICTLLTESDCTSTRFLLVLGRRHTLDSRFAPGA